MGDDEIQFRAVRDAAASGYEPLTRLQSFIVACVAVGRASVDPGLSATERYAELVRVARVALALAAAGLDGKQLIRARLVGGIQDLPHEQQVALSLRFEHDMGNQEIGAVMGLSIPEVRSCFAQAFETLWGGT